MGSDVSVVLHPDAAVPDVVIATQTSVHGGSADTVQRVVRRCPTLRVMNAAAATQLTGTGSPPPAAPKVTNAEPHAGDRPVLLIHGCAEMDAFTKAHTYVPVLRAIHAHLDHYHNNDHNNHHHHQQSATAPVKTLGGGTRAGAAAGSRPVCPIGLVFDPSLSLGGRLGTGDERAACVQFLKLFFVHLVAALEFVRDPPEPSPSPGTAAADGGGSGGSQRKEDGVQDASVAATAAAASSSSSSTPPPRLVVLYVDLRSSQLDDAAARWFATAVVMRAVRRARPFMLVAARSAAAGIGSGSPSLPPLTSSNSAGAAASGGGSGDAFLNYYSPDVKADMIWASLQHVLLTDNDISVDGAKAVVTELLAEDAAQDVRLRQQGIDPKVQRAREVTEAMAAHRLYPRPDTKLLPQLYLVDVQRKTDVDQHAVEEEKEKEKEKDAQAAKTINENSGKQQKKKGVETAATANAQEPAALAASGHPPPLPSPAVSSMPPSPQSRAPQPTAPHVAAAAAAAAAPSSSSPAPPPPTAQPAATRDVTKTPAASRTAKQFQQQQRAAALPATATKIKVPPQHTERRGQPPPPQQKHVQQVQQQSLPPSTAQSVDEDIAPSSSTPSLSAAAAAVPATAASTRTSEQGPISPAAHAPTPTSPPHRGPQVRSSPAAFKGSAAAAAHASTPWESGPAPTHSPDPGRLSPVPHRTHYDTHRSAAEAEEGGWSRANKNNNDDDDVDGGVAAAAMEDGPALPQLQRPSTGKTSPRVNVRAAPGAGTSPIRRTPEPTKRPAELPVAREAASIPPSAASPAAPPESPAKKTGGGSSSRAKPQPDPPSMTTPNEGTAATVQPPSVPAQQAVLRKDDDRHETAPHTAPPVGSTQSHAAATQQTRSAGAKERPPAAVEPHPSTPRQQQQPQASKAPSAPVSPSAAAARKPKPMVPESGEEEGKLAAASAAAPPSPRYSQRSTPKPAAATPQQQRPGTAPRTRQLMAPPPQLASSTRRARGAGGGMKKSPRKAGSRDPSPAAVVVVDELRMPDVVVRGHSARRSPERSAAQEGPPPYVVSPPVSARSPRQQPQQQQQLAEPRLPIPIQQDYSSRGMGEGESGGVPRTRTSAAGPPVISPRGRRPSAPHRQADEEAEMELPHHPSHHPHHSGGTADDEPWLDHVNPLETNSQHHHNNNSSSGGPFMGAKSGGYEEGAHTPRPGNRSPRSGRRRTFDITALDPPEPPYATAAAHVPPTMWEEGVRKRHPSPAQVAARKATGAERRASATSGRERRRRSSGFSSGAAGTDGHVVSPRKRSLLGTVDPVAEAKAAYEAATLAEARAKEQMERKREEQRQLQQTKPSSARPNGRASLRVEGEVQSVSETPLHRNAASTPVRVQTPQQQQQRRGAVEEEEGNTPSPAPNRPPGAHTPPSPRVPFTTAYADPSDPTGNADLDHSSFGAAPAPRKLNPYRRVSTATAPHITPRYTVTSRLRTVTSQRQRRVAEATAEIAGFYRSTAQPRRNFRGSEAFAALALPQPTREELRAVQADKERQYDRRYSMGGPVHSRHHAGNEDTSARLYSVDVNGSRRPSFAAGGTPSVSARGVRRETIHRDEAVSPPSREHSSRLHRAAAVPVSPRGAAAAAPSTPPPRRGGQPNTAAYPRVQSPRQKGAAAAAMDEDEGRDRNNSSAVSLSPWGTGDGPASTPRRGRVGGAAPGSPAEVSAYGVPLVHNALRTQKR